MQIRAVRPAFAIASALLGAGCSGGGGTPSTQPVPSAAPVAPPAPAGAGTLSFTILVPGRTPGAHAHRRLPAYVSASTAQARLTVQGQNEASPEAPQTFACTAVCTGSFAAPAGVDRVMLQLLDGANQTLSAGTATVVIFSGTTNQLSFTLDGVVASVGLTLTSPTLPVVPAAKGYVLFDARDADNNVITYNGEYADANDQPLVFDLKSSKASFVLGTTTVSGPGTLIPYSYDGTDHTGVLTLTPSLHPGVSATVAFTPATIKLLPGILRRISPPVPIAVLGVTQQPIAPGDFDPNADLVIGNGAGDPLALAFNTVDGTYSRAVNGANTGQLSSVPILTGDGFSAYVALGGNMFFPFYESRASAGAGGTNPNPCGFQGVPIGTLLGKRYCFSNQLNTANVYRDESAPTVVGSGLARKLQEINGTLYVVTDGSGGLVVSIGGTAVPKSLSVGANVDDPKANALIGYSDGSVLDAQTNASAGQFSGPVTSLIRNTNGTYVLENRTFGVASAGGVFETDQLPIGDPIDIIIGPLGAPAIVESDGTIDLIGL